MNNNFQIKEANSLDLEDITLVEKLAFGQDEEADLVKKLLYDKSADPVLSLLAIYNEKAVGHVLYTKATIGNTVTSPLVYILAPLAVIPEYQRKGIGGMLIKEGNKILQKRGVELVFVLGYMEYYPKYGFIPNAAKYGFPAPYPIPPENENAWMVQPLTSKGLSKPAGQIICSDELNKPEYWRE